MDTHRHRHMDAQTHTHKNMDIHGQTHRDRDTIYRVRQAPEVYVAINDNVRAREKIIQ